MPTSCSPRATRPKRRRSAPARKDAAQARLSGGGAGRPRQAFDGLCRAESRQGGIVTRVQAEAGQGSMRRDAGHALAEAGELEVAFSVLSRR